MAGRKDKTASITPEKRDTRRRFEQWAHNPNCQANTLSAVHGVSMAKVARREGLAPTMGQSPFAIARGQTFERGLFRNAAAELRKALEEAGVLPKGADGFADLRLKQHGGPMPDLDTAKVRTSELLMTLAKPGSSRPTVVASPTLLIPSGVMLPEALLVIDVLVVAYEQKRVVLSVGEIKTYPDRGGYTDGSELALARAQAGVYVHALRMVAEQLGIADTISVSDKGFLVLSRPGFNKPSVRAGEDLKYQAMRAARGFALLEQAAEELGPLHSRKDGGEPDLIEAVIRAGTEYNERCVTFCDRARACLKHALDAGNPSALGDDVERFLGKVTLDRAEALMNGARPRDAGEQELKSRLQPGH